MGRQKLKTFFLQLSCFNESCWRCFITVSKGFVLENRPAEKQTDDFLSTHTLTAGDGFVVKNNWLEGLYSLFYVVVML